MNKPDLSSKVQQSVKCAVCGKLHALDAKTYLVIVGTVFVGDEQIVGDAENPLILCLDTCAANALRLPKPKIKLNLPEGPLPFERPNAPVGPWVDKDGNRSPYRPMFPQYPDSSYPDSTLVCAEGSADAHRY